jgi:hypothetical protein
MFRVCPGLSWTEMFNLLNNSIDRLNLNNNLSHSLWCNLLCFNEFCLGKQYDSAVACYLLYPLYQTLI